jgi:hypothetical protein
MILLINDNLKIEDVQDQFAMCFPRLKLVFYHKRHGDRRPSPEEDQLDPQLRIGDIRKTHNSGSFEIKSWDTVTKVETDLKEIYGLNVQVFRNENNNWVQTSSTDHFTLKEEMEMCRQAEKSIFPKTKKQLDEYDFL